MARPAQRGGGQLVAVCPRPPAREGPPNYIASLLCIESVDGSQEAVGRVPPDNLRMVFLYITDSIFCFSALVIIYFVPYIMYMLYVL